ncbi:hypothetical protein [Methanococcus maripaludis]|uniref:Uncharacterized protein n=4 Tax=Methanococcus maripaludis TaxID=39152 RepID=Q6LZB1_METMP|nr:hypothetical protein [Methanococcus maripaludis]MBA2858375.1 hypothetical protein [Methanococcus maripaludis]BAP60888.1 hypothetical protein MMKA1_07710 [Methanococcus maripaludis KA1]BAP62850.1 hypothetical protein MMOS7_07640 [Methanococcus maripaludis OS7]CAF30274.1 hypothetical protein MMP0718 [Methanococcus maripaludis S2]
MRGNFEIPEELEDIEPVIKPGAEVINVSRYAKRRGFNEPVYITRNVYDAIYPDKDDTVTYFKRLYSILRNMRVEVTEQRQPFITFTHEMSKKSKTEFMAVRYQENDDKAWYVLIPR